MDMFVVEAWLASPDNSMSSQQVELSEFHVIGDLIVKAAMNNLLCLMDQSDVQPPTLVLAFAQFMFEQASEVSREARQRQGPLGTSSSSENNHSGNDLRSSVDILSKEWSAVFLGNAVLMYMESTGGVISHHSGTSPAACPLGSFFTTNGLTKHAPFLPAIYYQFCALFVRF